MKQCIKDYTSRESRVHPKNTRIVQRKGTYQCDTPHRQNKGQQHIIKEIDAEKLLEKIQHLLIIKILNNTGVEKNNNIISIYMANTHLL